MFLQGPECPLFLSGVYLPGLYKKPWWDPPWFRSGFWAQVLGLGAGLSWGQKYLCLAMDPPHTPLPPAPMWTSIPAWPCPPPSPHPPTPNSHGPPQPSKAVSDPSDHPWTRWLLQECARRHIGKDPVCLPIPASITCFPSPLPMQGSTCSSFSLAIA